jgi:outer membrane lipoprotein-sorting protein
MRSLLTLTLAALLLTLSAFAQKQEPPKVPATNPQFNALKTLSGSWSMKSPDGKSATETYRVVSGDSAIILEQNMPGEPNMITMFHPDGQRTVATHYCSMGNQPRMIAAASKDTKTIPFKFRDITNDDGKSGSMRDLTIIMLDKDHHNQVWTWQDAAGKQQTETFNYTRSTSSAQGK